MGDNLIILTNNPLLKDKHEGFAVKRVEALGLASVCQEAVELLQKNWKLVSTPLPPNLPLMRAPYRSLLLAPNTRQYDGQGLEVLQKAIDRLLSLKAVEYPETQAQDAAFIDRELLGHALAEIKVLSNEANFQ